MLVDRGRSDVDDAFVVLGTAPGGGDGGGAGRIGSSENERPTLEKNIFRDGINACARAVWTEMDKDLLVRQLGDR